MRMTLCASFIFFISNQVFAATIFSQTPLITNGGASDKDFPGSITGQRYVADNFSVATTEDLLSVTWRGFYYSDNTPLTLDSFTINIFSDSASAPGFFLGEFAVGNPQLRELTGDQITFGSTDYDLYEYSANLGAGFSLTANTNYWISIQNDTSTTSSGWYWAHGNDGLGDSVNSPSAESGSWTSINGNGDQYMLLSNASVVPIPAAIWLFGSAFAVLGWLRRKQTI
jgi:hypothetical protein